MRYVSLLLLFFSILKFPLLAQGIIEGTVFDSHSGKPLPAVDVKILELKRTTATDDSGRFKFTDVPPGRYRLLFTTLDYEQKMKTVVLTSGETVRLTVTLERHPKGHLDEFMKPRTVGGMHPAPHHRPEFKKRKHETAMVSDRMSGMHLAGYKHGAHASGLKAGFADDNRQFNYFVHFLNQYKSQARHYSLPIKERIWLQVVDAENRPVLNAKVQVLENGHLLDMGRTYADGSFFIFPLAIGVKGQKIKVIVDYRKARKVMELDRNGLRKVQIKLNQPRQTFQQIPLDLLFILDTTGSMGEEIERLKNTIEIINDNLETLQPRPDIRFGMVLYKDKEDGYDTLRVPFTKDLDAFRQTLNKVTAEGGGDTPEDLQAALKAAVHGMRWNDQAIRLAFIITDAPPHLDYNQAYTYVSAAKEAKRKGIKIFSIGTGGLDLNGEYVLRQIAQYTYGKYIFLTYGERGESEGGHPGSVSHHTGTNFQTDKLEAIIIRFAKEELAYQTDRPIAQQPSYFEAQKLTSEKKEETLQKLFTQALGELKDYATMHLAPKTKLSIIPVAPQDSSLKADAEYFTEQLTLAAAKDSTFHLVERKDLQYIARELGLELGGFTQPDNAAKVGQLLGADVLIIGKLFKNGNQLEMFLKLERVSTAEILSVTRLRIDPELGL